MLILWRQLGPRVPQAATAILCAGLAAGSLWFTNNNIGWTLLIQQTGTDEGRLQSDVPAFRSFPREPAPSAAQSSE